MVSNALYIFKKINKTAILCIKFYMFQTEKVKSDRIINLKHTAI